MRVLCVDGYLTSRNESVNLVQNCVNFSGKSFSSTCIMFADLLFGPQNILPISKDRVESGRKTNCAWSVWVGSKRTSVGLGWLKKSDPWNTG